MTKQEELVDLELFQHFATEKALRVSKDGDEKTSVWLPLSQIEVTPKPGGWVVVTLPALLAEKKELV